MKHSATTILPTVVLCLALVGCSSAPHAVSGRIVDDTVSLEAPALPMPEADLTVATAAPAERDTGARAGVAAVSPAASLTGLGSVVVIDSVAASEGDRVAEGDVIARLDREALDVNISVARANLSAAKAQVRVLDDALDTVRDNRATLASKRSEVDGAISQITRTRAQLAAKLKELKALAKRVEALRAMPRPSMPATLPPGVKPPKPPALPDPAELRAAIAQLEDGIAKLDAGLAQARSGRAQLSTASGELADARVQLRDLRDLARISVDLSRVGVRVASYEQSLAEIRTPYAGVVTFVLSPGDVVTPGATVATIRRDGPARVATWVPAEMVAALGADGGAAAGVTAGGTAAPRTRAPGLTVTADWAPGEVFSAELSRIGTRALYPPSSFATEEVHLTRAIPVELTLDEAATGSPAGAPVDVWLR